MKHFNSLMIALFIMLSNFTFAQTSTEAFETESPGNSRFTDNGVEFNIISHRGTFTIQGNYPGTGWNGTSADNRYIDNSSSTADTPASFSIKTTSNLFKVNRFWMYLGAANTDLGVQGTLTITGKLSGITKFSTIKTTGFNQTTAVTNGYTLIDLTNLNGQNYTNLIIDELQITLGGAYRYGALDAFTWVKDSNVIIDPNALQVTATTTTIACNGSATGEISLNVTGGTTPYTYLWSNGATSSTIKGLVAGNYSVTITDAANRTKTENYSVTQPSAINVASSKTDTGCGGANGAAAVIPTGGTLPYTYLWSNGATTSSINNLAAGNYSVTITDGNGCNVIRNFTINSSDSAPAPGIKLSFRNGDQLSVFETIGENIKWYQSKEDASQHINSISNTTQIVNNTTYYATQTVDGCESIEALTINAQSETLNSSDLLLNSSFKLYPNPTNDILRISTNEKINKVIVSDYNGRKLFERAPNAKNEVDVNSLSKGVYIIKIFTDKESKTMKFIKD
ncbi:Por secretion system C-terminal sorting domain-containing protein [Chishuiella changwenlii]|uniref:Por secretion system C-terminal sorting domain-containing protein n=1 Tax=Chishuiella changwenlii TaxID=1434701 RepID=A0A1M6YDX0_9FLAO|nr:T9SS type A sorting domain-containing protein [Chishuiella changwenlii]GGE97539.1 hypothetical protein GCM10010984_13880 [Chishuiella changwenlii]SHL16504.1 Por secretion system C-terminal sorting domain-containing protein [Chishuiella changwenlii]